MKPNVLLELLRFWGRQANMIKKGGLPVLLPKCLLALQVALAIPFVLILRALRPLVLVRFGQLFSLPIGMFAGQTELYLCQRDAGLHPKRTIDIFHNGYEISNQQLKTMWERKLHVSPLVRPLSRANNLLPGGRSHVLTLAGDADYDELMPKSRVHLSFTPEEERQGQAGLRDLGLPDGAPFVCIYGRDTGYKGRDTGHKWSSFLNRDEKLHGYRNVSIHNYLPAAEELARRGYFVIRMGAVVNEALRTTNPMIIDYATKGRSDFMDMYLCANCRFFLGCTGGLTVVPRIFRRPVIFANFVPLFSDHLFHITCVPNGLVIPKKLWLRDERRFFTFRELVETRTDPFPGAEAHFQRIGVDVIENTPEELLAVSVEADERLNGTWQTTEEDEELQQRLWSLLNMIRPNQEFWPRMGAEFLRQNRELLEKNRI